MWSTIFTVPNVIFLIPIAAIIVGGIVTLVTIFLRHRERMAMISQGMHPDHPTTEESEDSQPY